MLCQTFHTLGRGTLKTQCRLQNLRGDGRTCQSPPLFSSCFWSLQLVADPESTLNTEEVYEREARLIIDYSVLTADLQVGPQPASVPPHSLN